MEARSGVCLSKRIGNLQERWKQMAMKWSQVEDDDE